MFIMIKVNIKRDTFRYFILTIYGNKFLAQLNMSININTDQLAPSRYTLLRFDVSNEDIEINYVTWKEWRHH